MKRYCRFHPSYDLPYIKMSSLSYRNYSEINNLMKSFWENSKDLDKNLFNEMLKQNLSFIYYNQNTNKLVGVCLLLYEKNKNITNVSLLCIDKLYQGLKLGEKLLIFCLNNATEKNLMNFYLHVNSINFKAQNLYKKVGFEVEKCVPNYYNDEEFKDAYMMTLYL